MILWHSDDTRWQTGVLTMSEEMCLWCGDPVLVMAMIGTGYCCERHREAAEALAGKGIPLDEDESDCDTGE